MFSEQYHRPIPFSSVPCVKKLFTNVCLWAMLETLLLFFE